MKRKTAVLGFLVAVSCCVPALADWKTFTSERGRFSALFPDKPKEEKSVVDTDLGKMDLYQYSVFKGTTVYMVSFSDTPAALTGGETVLEGTAKGVQSSFGGTVTDDQKISLDGRPGRFLHLETPAFSVSAKFFWVRPRLYQLMVVAPKGKLNLSESTQFLDSFRFQVAEGAAPAPSPPPEPAAPANATLSIASKPGSVEVYMDDKRRGTTSAEEGKLVLDDLAPGSYKLRLSLAGYKDWAQSVTVTAGQSTEIQAEMKVAGPGAFALQDVVDMLRGEISPKRVVTLVQQRGVDFALTDEIEKQIRDAGGDSDLLVAIAKAKK